jgi:hypothetical protein
MSVAPFPRGVPTAPREFRINEFTRTWDDGCEVAQQFRDSHGPGKYQVTNLVPEQKAAAKIEYPNPTLLGREGFGYNNKSVDDDSRLRNNPTQEGRQRCPLHVQSRPFATVPYMGTGRGNPDVESALIYSEFARVERPCGTVTETFFDGQFTPLVPHLAAHIQNPANLIPEVASQGSGGTWIRSGLPTRQFIRDLNC